MLHDATKLIEMTSALFADATRCYDALDSEDTPFWRRAFVRSSLAFIEGLTALLKQQAFVAECNKIPKVIVLGSLSVLSGETYTVDDNGMVRARPIAIPALNNLQFAFRSYAEAQGSPFKLDKSGKEWAALRAAIGVRDRIMHPKHLDDLNISDSEIAAIETAVIWLNESLSKLLEQKARPPESGDTPV
jgi:hypothetical protein